MNTVCIVDKNYVTNKYAPPTDVTKNAMHRSNYLKINVVI